MTCKHCHGPLPDGAPRKRKYCSESCRKRAHDARHAAECEGCGQPVKRIGAKRCSDCGPSPETPHIRRAHDRRERIRALWLQGRTGREIAEHIGMSPRAVYQQITYMRNAGSLTAYRRSDKHHQEATAA